MRIVRLLPLAALPLVVFVGRLPAALGLRDSAPDPDGQIFVGRDAANRCVAMLTSSGGESVLGAETLATVYEASEAGLLSAEVSPALLADRRVGDRALQLLAFKIGECQRERSHSLRAARSARTVRSTFRRRWAAPRTPPGPPGPRSPFASRSGSAAAPAA